MKYNSKKYGQCYIAVGHIKIHSDLDKFKYKSDSNIQLFRENLYKDFKKYFNDKYIRHKGTNIVPDCEGYIYLPYFYILYNNMQNMLISDAYLPVNLDINLDYRFSLIFPMALLCIMKI